MDAQLYELLDKYGVVIYAILFLLIFSKTAFVLLTFIPGDSIVFASGILASIGELNGWLLAVLFLSATVLGDLNNYLIGRLVGKIKISKRSILPEKTTEKAEGFLLRHGFTAVIMARFVPLMRTSIPFVCGYMKYDFKTFVKANSGGGIVWVVLWLGAGLILGNFEWIEDNVTVSLAIISVIPFMLPMLYFGVRALLQLSKRKKDPAEDAF
ncbi:VTT domain-containing protein [Neobacillus mesonae]|nr:VTT domain-containing protein [Neobacillus mesonae]